MSAAWPDTARALEIPAGLSMANPRGNRPSMDNGTLAALAKLPPATDAEAAPSPACLVMTGAEVDVIEISAEALAEAQEALKRADQALAAAETLARRVPGLRQQAGVAAAKGFSGDAIDTAAVQHLTHELAAAELAASAVPALTTARDAAKNAVSGAFGSLRVNSQSAMRNALIRQGREYQRLAAEMVRVVGHMRAATDLLNDRELLSEVSTMFLPMLRLPAPPSTLISDQAAVADMNYRPTLLAYDHPRLTAHTSAARSRLSAQLQAAADQPPTRLMRG